MIKDVQIRKADAEDIRLFFPEGSPYTIYAWIAFYKGEAACLAGVIMKRGQAIPFADVKPNTASKRTTWMAAKELLEQIKTLELPLVTATECARSPFLEKLGFKHLGHNQGWEMYKCPS